MATHVSHPAKKAGSSLATTVTSSTSTGRTGLPLKTSVWTRVGIWLQSRPKQSTPSLGTKSAQVMEGHCKSQEGFLGHMEVQSIWVFLSKKFATTQKQRLGFAHYNIPLILESPELSSFEKTTAGTTSSETTTNTPALAIKEVLIFIRSKIMFFRGWFELRGRLLRNNLRQIQPIYHLSWKYHTHPQVPKWNKKDTSR